MNTESLNLVSQNIIDKIKYLDPTINYWLMRTNGGEYYKDFWLNKYIGISWNDILLQRINELADDKDKLIFELSKHYPSKSNGEAVLPRTYSSWASQLIRFTNELKPGDLILIPDEKSKLFRVGYITSDIYETSNIFPEILYPAGLELENIYKKSNFRKRYNVNWFGSFWRDEADAKLYKMTNTHHVITNINEYKPFINRVLFSAYKDDLNTHLTFKINQPTDISGIWYTRFTSNLVELAALFTDDDKKEDIVLKTNVQSAGIVELIFGLVSTGMVSGIIYLVLSKKSKIKAKLTINKEEGLTATILKDSENLELASIEKEHRKMTIEEIKAHDEHVAKQIENVENSLEVAKKIKEASDHIDGEAPADLLDLLSKISEVNLTDIETDETDIEDFEERTEDTKKD